MIAYLQTRNITHLRHMRLKIRQTGCRLCLQKVHTVWNVLQIATVVGHKHDDIYGTCEYLTSAIYYHHRGRYKMVGRDMCPVENSNLVWSWQGVSLEYNTLIMLECWLGYGCCWIFTFKLSVLGSQLRRIVDLVRRLRGCGLAVQCKYYCSLSELDVDRV